jgi:hypothetical protein
VQSLCSCHVAIVFSWLTLTSINQSRSSCRSVGFWTADAVASVKKYEWGGGCNGDKSKPHCPENLTQTVINARKMWGAVARALE